MAGVASVEPTERPHPEGLPKSSIVAQSAGLLAAEGMSVGLGLWAFRIGEPLVAYVTSNTLAPTERKYVPVSLLLGGLGGLAVAAAVSFARRAEGAEVLRRLSLRLTPFLVACLVPALFDWQIWRDRDLEFLVFVALTGALLQRLVRVSLSTEAAFPELRAPPSFERFRERLAWSRWARTLPLLVVCAGAAGYAAYFGFHTIRNHYRIGTAALDLGLENNLVWNAVHWGPLFKSSPLGGPNSSHGGFHQTYFAYLLGIPYRLAPSPQILLAIQAIFFGAAAIPLYLVAQRRLSRWVACLVALLYLLYAPLHGPNLYDFHYLPIGTFFLWTTLNLVEGRKYFWAALAVLCTVSVREDVAALLGVLGAYLLFSGRRPLPGLILGIVGSAYFVSLKMFLMPRFMGGGEAFIDMFRELLPEGERGYGGVLKTLMSNPGFTFGTMLERNKLIYVLHIMAPLAFFPLRRPIGLLCIVPGFLFTLLSTKYLPLIQPTFQYTTYWTVFLFVAVVDNLSWFTVHEREEPLAAVEWRASRRAWLAAIVVSMLATSYQFGAVLQQNTARGGFGPFRFDLKAADSARHDRLYRLIALVPPNAKITSSENIVPHVSNRPNSYTLRVGIFDADYLLLWMPPRGDEHKPAVDALKSGTFGVVAEEGEFVLAKRGHSTEKNAAVIAHYSL